MEISTGNTALLKKKNNLFLVAAIFLLLQAFFDTLALLGRYGEVSSYRILSIVSIVLLALALIIKFDYKKRCVLIAISTAVQIAIIIVFRIIGDDLFIFSIRSLLDFIEYVSELIIWSSILLLSLGDARAKKCAPIFPFIYFFALIVQFVCAFWAGGILRELINLLAFLFIGLGFFARHTNHSNESFNQKISHEFYKPLGTHVCLLLFTFGIWNMIWVHRITKFTNMIDDEENRDPTNKLLLYLFVPFYSIYWTYKTAQRIDKLSKGYGLQSDLTTICLILAIFLGFVPPILMQEKINQMIVGDKTPVNKKVEGVEKNEYISDAEALEKFKDLLDQGVITQEEFDAKKKQILRL